MKTKQRTDEFDAWVNGASEEEVKQMIKTVKKRQLIYIGVWVLGAIVSAILAGISSVAGLIAAFILMGIPMGCVLFCENNLVMLKSRGNKNNGCLGVWLMLICGLIVIPLITIQLASKIDSLGSKIIGL